MDEQSITQAPPAKWLIRISGVFAGLESDILRGLGAAVHKRLGTEYMLVGLTDPAVLRESAAAKFVRWNMPVHHSWPCSPPDIPGFIEKAAQALARKFAVGNPQTVMVGALDGGIYNNRYRILAANLRGRTLQLFPPHCGAIHAAELQDSRQPTLFCMVGKEGLFCGVQSPAAANGFHPGGSRYIRQDRPGTISRAGAKIAEALHHLQLYRPPPLAGSQWLELGASPGGMTAELLDRKYRVTAVDRVPLDKRLANAVGLRQVVSDAATFQPAAGIIYDAILSDMNGDARESIKLVARLTKHLRVGGLVVFTLKLTGMSTCAEVNAMEASVVDAAAAAGLHIFARQHLTYNRREFTLFFEYLPRD